MIRPRQGFGEPLRCRRIAARLDAYVDGELGERERRRVATHLAVCASCGRRYEELARQVGLIESLPRVAPSADLRRRIMTALPQRSAPGRARRRVWAWQPALAPVVLGAIIAAALLLMRPPAEDRRIAPTPRPPVAVAREAPAPPEAPVLTVSPTEESAAPAPARPRVRKAPPQAPQRQPEEETKTGSEVYRALGSEYEREGRLGEALPPTSRRSPRRRRPRGIRRGFTRRWDTRQTPLIVTPTWPLRR